MILPAGLEGTGIIHNIIIDKRLCAWRDHDPGQSVESRVRAAAKVRDLSGSARNGYEEFREYVRTIRWAAPTLRRAVLTQF